MRVLTGKGYPYNRMGAVVEKIKELGKDNLINWRDINKDTYKNFGGNKVFRISGSDGYYFTYDEKNDRQIIYRILSVDITRAWGIVRRVKAGEHIHYFKKNENYRIVDEELNYAKFEKNLEKQK